MEIAGVIRKTLIQIALPPDLICLGAGVVEGAKMTAMLRIFVSSVQKELEPASPLKALDGCLQALGGCNVYLLIVGLQYGALVGEISITHAEYRRAKEFGLPVLAFIKGQRQAKREEGTITLLAELDADGPKYKRFGNVIEL